MLYVKLIQCSGLQQIYGQLEEGQGQSVMKLIWCSGLPEIYAWLGGQSALGICALFYMWNLVGVVVFQRSMVDWGSLSALGMHALFYMWNLVGVVVFQRSMVNWGVSLP